MRKHQPTIDTVIIEFDLAPKHQLMLQALLQGEDGLAFVRCIDGVQQLWTTSCQLDEVDVWLKSVPNAFNMRPLNRYVWQRHV